MGFDSFHVLLPVSDHLNSRRLLSIVKGQFFESLLCRCDSYLYNSIIVTYQLDNYMFALLSRTHLIT